MKAPTGSAVVSVNGHSITLNNAADCYYDISSYATITTIDGEKVATFTVDPPPVWSPSPTSRLPVIHDSLSASRKMIISMVLKVKTPIPMNKGGIEMKKLTRSLVWKWSLCAGCKHCKQLRNRCKQRPRNGQSYAVQ